MGQLAPLVSPTHWLLGPGQVFGAHLLCAGLDRVEYRFDETYVWLVIETMDGT
jgi:hypothetical protein